MYTLITVLSITIILAVVLVVRTFACSEKTYPPLMPADIKIDPGRVAKKLSDAVRIMTIAHDDASKTDLKAFRSFARYLEKSFPCVHRVMDREVINNASLLYRWHGSDKKKKPALFCAHIDVVPVEHDTEADWHYPPFSGAIAENSVWGRGTQDIKNQLVSLFEAAELMIKNGFVPGRDIYFAFGHDEETRRHEGADIIALHLEERGLSFQYVLDEGGYVADNAVPGITRPVAFIGIAEKGFVNIHLTAKSGGGHSSMPPAHTAAGCIARAITKLETHQLPLKLTAPVLEMIRSLCPAMDFGKRLILSNLWLFAPLFKRVFAGTPSGAAFLRTTMAPTMLDGSDAPNVLPLSASAVVNARILHGESTGSLLTHVSRVISDDSVSIDMDLVYEPSKVSPVDSYAFSCIAGTIQTLWSDAIITPYLVAGGTDARKYEELTDCVYRFTPMRLDNGEIKQMHGTNEHISIENLADSVRFYTAMFGV